MSIHGGEDRWARSGSAAPPGPQPGGARPSRRPLRALDGRGRAGRGRSPAVGPPAAGPCPRRSD